MKRQARDCYLLKKKLNWRQYYENLSIFPDLVYSRANFEAFLATQVKTAVIKLLLLLCAIFDVYPLLPNYFNQRNKPFAREGSLTTATIILQDGCESFSLPA